MSFVWAFYEIPIESYAISKISDSLLKNSVESFNTSLNRKQSQEKLLNSTLFYNASPLKSALVEHSTKFLSKVMQFQRLVILFSKIPRLI